MKGIIFRLMATAFLLLVVLPFSAPLVKASDQACTLPDLKRVPKSLSPAWDELKWLEVNDQWLIGEPRHYGWLDVRKNGSTLEYRVTYWEGSPAGTWTANPVPGYWYRDLVDRTFQWYNIEIRTFEFSDPTKCGDKLWIAGAGLNWPSTQGKVLRTK